MSNVLLDPPELIAAVEAEAKRAGRSIDTLCEEAGVNRSTWTRTKSGTTSPNSRLLLRLTEMLTVLKKLPTAKSEAA